MMQLVPKALFLLVSHSLSSSFDLPTVQGVEDGAESFFLSISKDAPKYSCVYKSICDTGTSLGGSPVHVSISWFRCSFCMRGISLFCYGAYWSRPSSLSSISKCSKHFEDLFVSLTRAGGFPILLRPFFLIQTFVFYQIGFKTFSHWIFSWGVSSGGSPGIILGEWCWDLLMALIVPLILGILVFPMGDWHRHWFRLILQCLFFKICSRTLKLFFVFESQTLSFSARGPVFFFLPEGL